MGSLASAKAASIAVLAGAVGSVGLLLSTTDRNPSQLLVVLLASWVVSPFVALLWANIVSKGWSVRIRVTLHRVMLVVPLSSLAVYVADAIWPRTSPGSFALVVLAAALISGRRSRRADGA